jgi:hypothetical protein
LTSLDQVYESQAYQSPRAALSLRPFSSLSFYSILLHSVSFWLMQFSFTQTDYSTKDSILNYDSFAEE